VKFHESYIKLAENHGISPHVLSDVQFPREIYSTEFLKPFSLRRIRAERTDKRKKQKVTYNWKRAPLSKQLDYVRIFFAYLLPNKRMETDWSWFGEEWITNFLSPHFPILRCWNSARNKIMRSWCDVKLDYLPPYAWINSRRDDPIIIKYNIIKFYEKLSKHFNFRLNRTVLTIASHKSMNIVLSFLRYEKVSTELS
jgi:hypothetical protein